ncbi:3-hydroxyacyl-CoA dehydrogenase [Massilia sp. HP4]|uniref:3-hydroxyacyl-CoA dehydrogenase n=1 Tax=Massilia sp. HP4 TaxID=2562316 RepID=UPI0010C0ED6C|nr:3-hydroxyacyl-CoA dehydrogenase [Massilia sp. HP4]
MIASNKKAELIGVAGSGLMGQGIAQLMAQAGIPVLLYDTRQGAAEEARAKILDMLDKLAAKGRLSAQMAQEAGQRLGVAGDLADFGSCTIVIEAIVEKLEAKRALFSELEGIVAAGCILATNTSSLSVTVIAAGCRYPDRVAGFHFFSPVPLMKVVEVISGPLTDPTVAARLVDVARRTGHTPVRAADTPGFIVNHAGRGYLTESLRLLAECIAPHAEIDRILQQAAGFRMGPFELLDLTGLDVSHPVMESIYEQYYQEPRFRPSPIARQRLAAGLLGRKTSRGFYHYTDGVRESLAQLAVPGVDPIPVWLPVEDRDRFPGVLDLLERLGAELALGALPPEDAICLVLPVGQDVTTAAVASGIDPLRCVGLDPLFPDGCRTLMATPVTKPRYRDSMHALLASDGKPVSVIRDSPGFVAQRVIATIVNIGCDIAQQGISSPQEIDHAVTLGLGYPMGPLAMGDKFGAKTILEILEGLHTFYLDPRYRPSPWLKRRALLGVSLLAPASE